MADVERLQARFSIAATDQRRRSPFNTRLLSAIADRPDLASILQAAPEEQQLPVLLLAAVHSIVLREPGIELADWYPTVRDTPRTDDPFPAFARLCSAREDELRTIVSTHSTQTNEVGRCALFLPVLGRLGAEHGDLALVDVGTSAGLNLQLDRYAYHYPELGRRVGGPSAVELTCGVRGRPPVPDAIPRITHRAGIDRSPIDLADDAAVRWLMACVWPDQRDRFERLAAAIDIARHHPVPIVVGDAVGRVGAAIDAAGAVAHPVVLTSWVLNYLTPDERAGFVAELDRIGAGRDLAWVVLESPGLCTGLPVPAAVERSFLTHLLLIRWTGGRRTVEHLAECHPHGYWMHWEA